MKSGFFASVNDVVEEFSSAAAQLKVVLRETIWKFYSSLYSVWLIRT